jgi:hypothetical protein
MGKSGGEKFMRKRKYKLDVQLFKSLKSCKDLYEDGQGGFCVMGKVAMACGYQFSRTNAEDWQQFWVDLGLWPRGLKKSHSVFWLNAALHNNLGNFEHADDCALRLALQSGNVLLVNTVKQPAEAPIKAPKLKKADKIALLERSLAIS